MVGEIDIGLDKLILVAPPSKNTNIDTIKSFFPYRIPDDIKSKESIIIVSDNDEYIDIQEAKEFASACKAHLEIIPNAGHINTQSGFGKWEYIEKLLEQKSDS